MNNSQLASTTRLRRRATTAVERLAPCDSRRHERTMMSILEMHAKVLERLARAQIVQLHSQREASRGEREGQTLPGQSRQRTLHSTGTSGSLPLLRGMMSKRSSTCCARSSAAAASIHGRGCCCCCEGVSSSERKGETYTTRNARGTRREYDGRRRRCRDERAHVRVGRAELDERQIGRPASARPSRLRASAH